MRATVELPGGPASARSARLFVDEVLRRQRLEHVNEVVVLLTSELVTNAILHVGAPIEVAVEVEPAVVRVEVHDPDSRAPVPRLDAPDDATAGRGLALVEGMASAWGVVEVPGDGKRVWFEVRL